jgi:hypothetical protein
MDDAKVSKWPWANINMSNIQTFKPSNRQTFKRSSISSFQTFKNSMIEAPQFSCSQMCHPTDDDCLRSMCEATALIASAHVCGWECKAECAMRMLMHVDRDVMRMNADL